MRSKTPTALASFVLFCSLLFISLVAPAKTRYAYNVRATARQAHLAQETYGPASHLFKTDFTQKARWAKAWSGSLGVRAAYEETFQTPNPHYEGDVSRDTITLLPKDTYLRYAGRIFSAQSGYQTVVWGEAFGTTYTDLINPKDYREASTDDLVELQVPLAMVNMQWIMQNYSLQFLYLPVAQHHLLPLRGSPFYLLPETFRVLRSEPEYGRADFGLRYSFRWGDADISLLGLRAADRFPLYDFALSGSEYLMKPRFATLSSTGATLTSDFGFLLLRAEVMHHFERELQKGGLEFAQTTKSNELVYVLGFDLTQFPGWQIGVQGSEFILNSGTYLFRKSRESLGSIRIAYEFANELSIETMASRRLDESSLLIQPKVSYPFSNKAQVSLGADLFSGDRETAWGSLSKQSRVYLKWVAFLKK